MGDTLHQDRECPKCPLGPPLGRSTRRGDPPCKKSHASSGSAPAAPTRPSPGLSSHLKLFLRVDGGWRSRENLGPGVGGSVRGAAVGAADAEPSLSRHLSSGGARGQRRRCVRTQAGRAPGTRVAARQRGLRRLERSRPPEPGGLGAETREGRVLAAARMAEEPAEAARPGEKGQSFSGPSAIRERDARACGSGVRGARGVLASFRVRSPETQRGLRPPFVDRRGRSLGSSLLHTVAQRRFPGAPRPKLSGRRLYV
ncbi:uncharacterized protein LOC116664785 [Camelus ferus]|uniref:Uncharacterized protein LOC116664785 n=1 Tax=Camelus ferus TaxID=419612 RepID=A0A8B8TAG3_CAMFR|nr:uncharacterized protein LOC116664785 [Camelus ferus]